MDRSIAGVRASSDPSPIVTRRDSETMAYSLKERDDDPIDGSELTRAASVEWRKLGKSLPRLLVQQRACVLDRREIFLLSGSAFVCHAAR